VIPFWYLETMAMTLRLNDEEMAALKRQAETEHRSMQEVARLAILQRINGYSRADFIRENTELILERDAEALRLLAE
jgi:predicted transcriptional regulator